MADKFKTTPTYNPAAKENLGLALQHLVKYVSTNLECSIPAKIVKYDRTTHVATVQPLVKIQYPDGDQVKSEERQQFDVTVLQFCHGGFVIDIPLSEGDTGWVVASDRDAVLAKKANANIKAADNKGAQDPNTSQKHRYNLGFFIPDSWATIPYDMEKFDGKMVIGDVENIDDPAAYITLDHDGHIVIHADKEVIFETELITFDCNVHIKKNLEVDGDSLLHGNLKVEGKDNKINDMTEQEIKFFSDVVKKDGKTYLVLSKTNVLRSDLEKVDEIEFKGGSGDNPDDPGGGGEDPDDPEEPDDPTGGSGGGGGSVNNVVAWVPFVCRRKEAGDSSVEYFLPEHTAKVNDEIVDFTTNFPASGTPGWRTSSETNNSGTIYCTINKKQDGTFVGHFTNAAVQIGTVDDDEEVMYCFAVCKIDGSIGDGKTLDGITQYAAGEMVFKEKTVHTPFGIETIDGVKTITNGVFYWNNEIIEVDDLEVPDSDTVYLVVSRELPDGEWTAELDTEEGESDDEVECYSFKLYDFEDGEVSTDYRTTFLALGTQGKSEFVGDDEAEASQVIKDTTMPIVFQGFKGEVDGERTGNSGLEFLTVGERTGDEGEKIPAKVIVDVKGRSTASGCGNTENWGCHALKKNGNLLGHFLGCRDIDIVQEGGAGGGGGDVIGSDYIEVNDETETDDDGNTITKRKVEAKVTTPVNQGNAANPNALVTHNTNQYIRCIKTFLGLGVDNNLKKVVIDGPNGKIEIKNAAGNRMIRLDSADIPNDCGKNGNATISVHSLKFIDNDGNEQIYHGLFCDDIDMTRSGKLIKETKVTASADPNGMNTIKFTYTDGTYDEFKVMNGMNGSPGSPGQDGDTPEITAERNGEHIYIYADGDLIATLEDGHTPEITAQRTSEKQTTIYADGVAIAVINDGETSEEEDDDLEEMEVVTGVTFEFSSDGKTLNAKVSKKKVKAVLVEALSDSTVKVCDAENVDVVVESSYNSDGSYKFKNVRKRVKVIGTPTNATGQDVFTTTPLSGENV